MRRLVTVVLLLMLVGCGGGGGTDEGDAAAPEAPGFGGGGEDGVAGVPIGQGTVLDEEAREIIYTASLGIRTEDVEAAVRQVESIAEAAGGLVFSSDVSREPRVRADIVIKVPPAEFETALEELRTIGRVISETVDAEDVTADVVDLESRIESAETSIRRLRELLEDAATVTDVIAIESELARREAELESAQGRLRVLRSQVDLATITVTLGAPDDPELVEDLPGFFGGLRRGAVAFANFFLVLLSVLGFALPFLAFFGLIVGAIVLLVRWRSRKAADRRGPAPAPQPTSSPRPPPGVPPPPTRQDRGT